MRLDVPPSESDEPLLPANDLSNSSMKRIEIDSAVLRRYAGLPLSVPPLNHRIPVPYLAAEDPKGGMLFWQSATYHNLVPGLAFPWAEANRTSGSSVKRSSVV